MAVVYCARDRELDRDVAIKVLAEHLASDVEFRQRFLRESRLAAKLSHPNVVSVYDGGETDGLPYIVMEYVEGVTLADELARRGRLSPDEATGLAIQACAGLEHAHDTGLVHRDVKPQNLLLRTDGVLKIADFGIARAVEGTQLTEAGTVLGTAVYLSPEQASGEQVSPAADIYSLGAVMYELIAGQPPFSFEKNIPALVLKKRTGRVPSLRDLVPELPDRLDEIVLRCLSPEPSARPSSATELAQELAGFAPDAATVPFPAAARPVTTARSRRPLWPLAAAAVALAVIAGGILLAARDGGGSNPASQNPPAVQPVPPGSTPAERARNLADWIRDNSG
jgi:eukaryotic-like serine/threonine-protein kinase